MKHQEREERFVHQWDSLFRDCGNPSKQTMIDASGTLRTLWTNNGISEANARHRISLKFPVYQHRDPELRYGFLQAFGPVMEYECLTYSAENAPPSFMLTMLPKNAFMAIVLLRTSAETFNVSDIINYVANNYGAAHWGTPRGRLKDLSDVEHLVILNDVKVPLHAMKDIAMCTLLGTAPLYTAITGRSVTL